jgi:hypothetical protein
MEKGRATATRPWSSSTSGTAARSEHGGLRRCCSGSGFLARREVLEREEKAVERCGVCGGARGLFIAAERRTVDAVQRAPAVVRARRRPVEGAATLLDARGAQRARWGGVARSGTLGRVALPWMSSGGARRARSGGLSRRGWCLRGVLLRLEGTRE